MMRNIQGAVT